MIPKGRAGFCCWTNKMQLIYETVGCVGRVDVFSRFWLAMFIWYDGSSECQA